MLNKKAQTGEIITWFVATMIIVVVLGITIYVSVNVLGNTGFQDTKIKDLFAQKSFTAYLLTEDNSGRVYNQLILEEELNDSSGFLAQNIFNKLYPKKDYDAFWLGLSDETKGIEKEIYNIYFKGAPSGYLGGSGPGTGRIYTGISENVYLNENKSIGIILVEKFI